MILGIVVTCGGLMATTAGVAAYTGRWRSWAGASYPYAAGFGLAFLGVGLLAAGGILLVPDLGSAQAWTLAWVSAVGSFIQAMSMMWLPRFLCPSWFLAGRSPSSLTVHSGGLSNVASTWSMYKKESRGD